MVSEGAGPVGWLCDVSDKQRVFTIGVGLVGMWAVYDVSSSPHSAAPLDHGPLTTSGAGK